MSTNQFEFTNFIFEEWELPLPGGVQISEEGCAGSLRAVSTGHLKSDT